MAFPPCEVYWCSLGYDVASPRSGNVYSHVAELCEVWLRSEVVCETNFDSSLAETSSGELVRHSVDEFVR